MKTESKNKTGNGPKNAQSALAEINAEIEALNLKRIALAEPMKSRYAELRKELADMVTEIRSLDENWTPEPTKPKAETKIAEVITAHGSPMTADEIVAAVADVFGSWKTKSVLKKRSTGPKALFTLADGRYSLKAAA
jgi:hypothetical protein